MFPSNVCHARTMRLYSARSEPISALRKMRCLACILVVEHVHDLLLLLLPSFVQGRPVPAEGLGCSELIMYCRSNLQAQLIVALGGHPGLRESGTISHHLDVSDVSSLSKLQSQHSEISRGLDLLGALPLRTTCKWASYTHTDVYDCDLL